jgi:hypothetical protein
MSRAPLPRAGCFEASYPATEWQEVSCISPPSHPAARPGGRRANPDTVGGASGDFAAKVASGVISTAEGSFLSVTPGIFEAGIHPNSNNKGALNAFTLHLNTNTFATAACNSYPGCSGWQQFVFENDGDGSTTSMAAIQYWLLNYWPTGCPTGWNPSGGDCFINGSNGVSVPAQTMADLAQISLMGAASGGMDTLKLLVPNQTRIYAMSADSLLDLAPGWNTAEFNIFGDGNGTEADFSSGSTIVVKPNEAPPQTDKMYCVLPAA